MKQRIWNTILIILVVLLAILNAVQLTLRKTEVSKLDQLQALIDEKFVGEADPEALGDAAAAAMIEATGDRWSFYTPAKDAQSFQEQMDNAYVGVGITIRMTEDESGFLVMKVNPESPAEEAGILAGDIIVEVSGQKTGEIGMEAGRNLVRGPEGTYVDMVILREGRELPMHVERRSIETVVAEGRMVTDTIGLVSILNFDTRSSQETIAAIEALQAQGADKLIFDVRFNPGGFVHEMVNTLDYLLPEGDLITTVSYKGDKVVDTSDEDFLDLPMVVLVNKDSYSAAEFFAAAMQEYGAAKVVGEKTSGKGYFQITYRLNDGSSVNLSSGKYFTPKGVCLQDIGLTPDVEITVDEETGFAILAQLIEDEADPQLQAAIRLLQEVEPLHLSTEAQEAA